MRRVCLAVGASAALVMIGLTTGLEAGCAKCAGWGGLYAGPCGVSSYGALSPGCCEHTPSECDHIWDGYCQERHHCCGSHLCRPTCWRYAEPACQPSMVVPTPSSPATVPTPPTIVPTPAPAAPEPEVPKAPQTKKVQPPKKQTNDKTSLLMRLPDTERFD